MTPGVLTAPPSYADPGTTARLARRYLRGPRARRRSSRRSPAGRVFDIAFVTVVVAALAAGALPGLWGALTGPALAASGAQARLFVVAVLLLLMSGTLAVLRAAGPVSASRAMHFWVLSAPVSLRRLLRPRCVALMVAAALVFAVVAAPLAHLAGTGLVVTVAAAAVGGLLLSAASVWAQTSDVVAHILHSAANVVSGAAMLAFGSLATGLGRAGANAVLALPAIGIMAVLAAALVVAGYCVLRAIRGLDRITPAELRRGEGLWTSARLSTTTMDLALLGEFLADQRARAAGRVRSSVIGRGFVRAALTLEWSRLRRNPALVRRTLMSVAVWWGCRAVLTGPAMVVLAVIGAYLVALPMAATIRELTRRHGLRDQFVPGQQRVLVAASLTGSMFAVLAWTLLIWPGLPAVSSGGWAAAAPVVAIAACRAASRPPLDYTAPPVSTPFGDIPVDLLRQILRGHLLVAMTVVALLV